MVKSCSLCHKNIELSEMTYKNPLLHFECALQIIKSKTQETREKRQKLIICLTNLENQCLRHDKHDPAVGKIKDIASSLLKYLNLLSKYNI